MRVGVHRAWWPGSLLLYEAAWDAYKPSLAWIGGGDLEVGAWSHCLTVPQGIGWGTLPMRGSGLCPCLNGPDRQGLGRRWTTASREAKLGLGQLLLPDHDLEGSKRAISSPCYPLAQEAPLWAGPSWAGSVLSLGVHWFDGL